MIATDLKAKYTFPRISRLKNKILSTERKLYIERARLITESWQQTEGDPTIIRKAKALRHILRHMTIEIDPDELIVGNRSPLPRMGVVSPEMAVEWIDQELETLPTRPQDSFAVDPRDIEELRHEIFPYWRGRTLYDQVKAAIPPDVEEARQAKVFKLNQTDHGQGHTLPNVERWIHQGPRLLLDQARRLLETASPGEKADFYLAAIVSLEGAIAFIERYAHLAEEQAALQPAHRVHLEESAAICRRLAAAPPRTFRETVQALWFLFVILEVESNASGFSPGRLDQYLYPYYRRDLEAGRLSQEEALELLESLWLKFNEIVLLRNAESARYFGGFPIGFNVILGGQTLEGQDATNELSYLCLQAQADLGLPQPNLSVRLHSGTPERFLLAASQVISYGGGMPQIFNDEVIIPALLNRGYPPEEAYNYAVIGCVEISVPGNTSGWSGAALFNMVKVLELTMTGGIDRLTGRPVGPATDGHFSFEAFERAYEKQMAHFVELMVKGSCAIQTVHAQVAPTPFLSTVIDDCLEKGRDVSSGGARYNFCGVQGVQVANVADSLAAIKQLVFEEGALSLSELNHILDVNFEGYEPLRQRMLNRVPKYGNDHPYVDELAHEWATKYCQMVERYPTPRGGIFQPGFYTVSAHLPQGQVVAATPDGRPSQTPLADGGLSPMRGLDQNGPTAVLKSVSQVDQRLASNGCLLNLKFMPSFFQGEGGLKQFAHLLRGLVELKIMHTQFNVISASTLRQAQKHPEQFRNLVVRVAGYSAYFTELNEELQNEIIARTEHTG